MYVQGGEGYKNIGLHTYPQDYTVCAQIQLFCNID